MTTSLFRIRTGRGRVGFSLIEMLAAMSVLAIIMLMLSRLFNDSTRAIKVGTAGTDVNASARAVMDFMARDVSLAILDAPDAEHPPYLHLRIYNDEPVAGSTSLDNVLGLRMDAFRSLMFVAPLNTTLTAAEPRSTRAVLYRMRTYQQKIGGSNTYQPNRYELIRGEAPLSTNATTAALYWYENPNWSDRTLANGPYIFIRNGGSASSTGVIIQNVRDFSLSYHSNYVGNVAAITDPAKTRTDVTPLAYLDIRLELLPEEDAIRAAEMWSVGSPSQTALLFVERAVRRYFRRVYFFNRRQLAPFSGE